MTSFRTVSVPYRYRSMFRGRRKTGIRTHLIERDDQGTILTACGEMFPIFKENLEINESSRSFTCMQCARAKGLF